MIYEDLKDAFIQQEHWNKLTLKHLYANKKDISLKNENSIIIYSPITYYKYVWAHIHIYIYIYIYIYMKNVGNQSWR